MSHPTDRDHRVVVTRGRFGSVVSLVGGCGWLVAYRAARSGARAARRDSKGGAPPHSAGFSAKADSNRSREAARLGSGVGRPTHSTVERAEFHIAIGAPGFGVLVMWALRGGATSEMPGRAAALPASAPNWRRAESNLERAPQVGVNLESTSASWSQPGVALKTWSQHLKPGASSLQLERARSNWSELAPSWSEVGASGASEKSFSNLGPSGRGRTDKCWIRVHIWGSLITLDYVQ